MCALKQAPRPRLQRYADRIRKLNEDYPRHWWIIGLADIHMRSEHLERVRRKCVERKAKGDLPDYDALRPWDVAFREAAAVDKYWSREVGKNVFLYTSSITTAAKVADPGFGVIEELPAGSQSGAAAGGATGRQKRKRGAQSDAESAASPDVRPRKPQSKKKRGSGPNATTFGQRSGSPRNRKRADHKRPDGRFSRSADGLEICFKYAHQLGGCSDNCPQKRVHICEWCRGSHRSVECTQKPKGWTP